MAVAPEGWYPDPQGEADQRFFDGQDWTSRTRRASDPSSASGEAGAVAGERISRSDEEYRRLALARAIEQNPGLATGTDTESMSALNEIAENLEQEIRRDDELADVRRAVFAEQARVEGERARAERARIQQEREIALAEERQKKLDAEAQLLQERKDAEDARLAAMNPIRRWTVTHKGLAWSSGIVAAVVMLGLASLIVGISMAERKEQQELAQKQEILNQCDAVEAVATNDMSRLTVWAECEDAEVRAAVASNWSTRPPVVKVLATDSETSVRLAVASRENLPGEVAVILAKDDDSEVQLALAAHDNLPPEALEILGASSDASVQEAVSPPSPNCVLLQKELDAAALSESVMKFVRDKAEKQGCELEAPDTDALALAKSKQGQNDGKSWNSSGGSSSSGSSGNWAGSNFNVLDDNLAFRWVKNQKCSGGQSCSQAIFKTRDGCQRGLYVEANFFDGNGNVVDWDNDTVPALDAGQKAKLTFGSYQSVDLTRIVDWSCRN